MGVAWGMWMVSGTWGLHMYVLVGARHVERGLGGMGEAQVCGWAGTCASWMGRALSCIVVVSNGARHCCDTCDVSPPAPRGP